jgi:amino acid transporter
MTQQHQLRKGSLGLWSVIFFVIAAASPLTGVVGGLPVAFFAGNGAGVPGVFCLAGLLLIVFSFGFVAMSKYVVNAGAFYSYIAQGLGVRSGMAGLGIALLAYLSVQLSVTALFGFYSGQFIQEHLHINVPWWIYAIAMQCIVVMLGIAKVELGGRVLGFFMIMEVAIVLVLDGAMLTVPGHFEFDSFGSASVLHGNIGIALVFAICSFVGFEATAIYSEECREPGKVIPRATLLAVVLIAAFFALTSWSFVQYAGAAHIMELAAKDPGLFVFAIAEQVLGHWSVEMMSVLLITSLFAATQAFHNTLSRYLFAISRDGLIWAELAQTHPKFHTPYRASMVQGAFICLMLVVFAIGHLATTDIFAWLSALGSIAILTLQCGVSMAVVAYFLRNTHLAVSLWSRLIAPVLATVGMMITLVLVVSNLSVLSGSNSPFIVMLPCLVLAAGVGGFMGAHILRRVSPERYTRVGQIIEDLH